MCIIITCIRKTQSVSVCVCVSLHPLWQVDGSYLEPPPPPPPPAKSQVGVLKPGCIQFGDGMADMQLNTSPLRDASTSNSLACVKQFHHSNSERSEISTQGAIDSIWLRKIRRCRFSSSDCHFYSVHFFVAF